MARFLFVSGSPRQGNTDFILNKIFESTNGDKELIFLRDKNIQHCFGCLSCSRSDTCFLNDDMQSLYKKMLSADVFIIGSPNYFDNVSGILKDFIDRTCPFYGRDSLKGKKLLTVVVGAGKLINSKRVTEQALTYFADYHHLELIGSYCFRGLKPRDVEHNPGSTELIAQIIKKVNLI